MRFFVSWVAAVSERVRSQRLTGGGERCYDARSKRVASCAQNQTQAVPCGRLSHFWRRVILRGACEPGLAYKATAT